MTTWCRNFQCQKFCRTYSLLCLVVHVNEHQAFFLDHIFVWLSVSKRRLLVPVTKSLRSQVVPYRKCCGTKGLCAYTVYRPLININTPRFTGIPGRGWSQTASRRGVAVRRLVSLRERQRAWSVRAKRESVSQDGLYRCLLERLMKERCASGHYPGGGGHWECAAALKFQLQLRAGLSVSSIN